MSHTNRVHWPWPVEDRKLVWSGIRHQSACRSHVRSYSLRLTNEPDLVTCLRCKALLEEAEQAFEKRMADEYRARIDAFDTKRALAALEAYKAIPRCTEEADIEGDRFQCTHRATENHEHRAEAADGRTGQPIVLRWYT